MNRMTRSLALTIATLAVGFTFVALAGCERDAKQTGGSGADMVRRPAPEERPELEFELFAAIGNDDEAQAMELVERGAPVHALSDARGVTVLHRSAQMSMPNLTRLLLEYGADVNARVDGVHHQPIHWAARAGCSERPGRTEGAAEATIDVLLEYGADINSTTQGGVRPIDYAIELNAPAWKEFLISRGARE